MHIIHCTQKLSTEISWGRLSGGYFCQTNITREAFMDIKNKVIIITGASQGIGLATAKLLSARGGKIVLSARSTHVIEELQKELPNSLAVTTDMRKPEDIVNLINKTMEKFGRIDILINNAGQGMRGW